MGKKLNIIVLGGGLSEEREVSVNSAKAIYDAIQRLGYKVSLIDPATGLSLIGSDGKLINDDSDKTLPIAGTFDIEKSLGQTESDLVYIGLHGGAGEDGTIQAMLDLAGIRYTGSGHLASTVAMNKAFTKHLMRLKNIPTPDWLQIKKADLKNISTVIAKIEKSFSFPLIVKPNDSGSTVGLTLVREKSMLTDAITDAAKVTDDILVEQYCKGREITAAVLDGEAYPLVEIVPTNELYDYHCKYTKGGSQYFCPADIPEEISEQIKKHALTAYNLIQCSGLVRADFIYDGDQINFLEINTLRGMTELSLAPMAAKEAGYSFDDLISKIIESALMK